MEEPETEPRYVFQDPVSFSSFGNALEYQGDINLVDEGARVFSLTAEDLDFLFDLKGVVSELSLALERAEKLTG